MIIGSDWDMVVFSRRPRTQCHKGDSEIKTAERRDAAIPGLSRPTLRPLVGTAHPTSLVPTPRAAWERGSSAPRRASGRCPAFVYPSRVNILVSEVCRWYPKARRGEEDRRAGKRSASRRYCDG